MDSNSLDPTGLMIFLTALIGLFTILTYKVYERIAWLTGSMESHSTMMLRIEALRANKDGIPVKIVWWDPNIEDWPFDGSHGQEATLDTIYLGVPEKYRQKSS